MPAGIVSWDGSSSTAWTTAANWTADGTLPGSTPPAAGDWVIFDARTVSNNATTVMAVGDTGGIDFALLHIKKGHTGNIGVAGAPLHTSAQKIVIEGSGTYYIEISENATGADQIVPLVIINNPDCTVYLTSNENTGSWCCEITNLILIAGTVHIGNNGSANVATAVQYIKLAPRSNVSSAMVARIYPDCIRSKATAYNPTIDIQNGTLTCDSAINSVSIFAGTLNYGIDLVAAPETGLNITAMYIYGGTVNWYPDDSDNDAYIATLWVYGGTLTAIAATNNDRIKFLGNGAGYDIHLFTGGTINVANNMGNIKIAASSQLWNHGGTLITDIGSELGISYDT